MIDREGKKKQNKRNKEERTDERMKWKKNEKKKVKELTEKTNENTNKITLKNMQQALEADLVMQIMSFNLCKNWPTFKFPLLPLILSIRESTLRNDIFRGWSFFPRWWSDKIN